MRGGREAEGARGAAAEVELYIESCLDALDSDLLANISVCWMHMRNSSGPQGRSVSIGQGWAGDVGRESCPG